MSLRRDEVNLIVTINGKAAGNSINDLQKQAKDLRRLLVKLPVDSDEFKKTKAELDAINQKLAEATGKVKQVDSAMFSLRGGFTKIKELLSPAAILGGITALVTIAANAASEIGQMAKEMSGFRKEVNALTGAEGKELDNIVVKSQAIAKTFNEDQRQVLQAANTLAKEFGITQSEALDKIAERLVKGGDVSGELLDNIKEYSVQFSAAEASADEFLDATLLAQNEGIFSDKGLDVVKEFGIRIREQTKATSDAMVAAFGPQFTNKLFKGINDGSISTVEALKMVSKEMNNTEIPANRLQTVIADVFGGPGEDAGLRYIQSLQNIQTELVGTTGETSKYRQATQDLLLANEELATSQNELTKQLEDTQGSLATFWTNIKAGALNVLVDVLQFFEKFSATADGIGAAIKQFFTNAVTAIKALALDAQIAFEQVSKANPFGDTNAQINDNIATLRQRRSQLEAEYKTAGKAYREAYLAGLKEVDARQQAARALANPANAGTGTGTGTGTSGAPAKQVKDEFAMRQKEIQAGYERENLLIEQALITQEITQQEALNRRLANQLDYYTKLLNLLTKQGKAEENQYLENQNKLLQTQQQMQQQQALAQETAEIDFLETLGLKTIAITQKTTDEIVRIKTKGAKQNAKTAKRTAQEEAQAYSQAFGALSGAVGGALDIAAAAGKEYSGLSRTLALIQIGLNAAQGVSAAVAAGAGLVWPANLAAIASGVGSVLSAIAQAYTVLNSTPELAHGGDIDYVSGERINSRQNIRTRRSGDNVLAYVRRGEVVLNESQQAALGGPATFRRIGVPGFAVGGRIPDTTPTAGPPPFGDNVGTEALAESRATRMEFAALRRDINAWQQKLQVQVKYQDIAKAGTTLAAIQAEASL